MFVAQYLLALSLLAVSTPTVDTATTDKWLHLANTENAVLEVSNDSISIDKVERSVEFILRTTLQSPMPVSGGNVKVVFDSVIVLCTQRLMVVMTQYGRNSAGEKTFENFQAKVLRFTGNSASVSDGVISVVCRGLSTGESGDNNSTTPLQQRAKPGLWL